MYRWNDLEAVSLRSGFYGGLDDGVGFLGKLFLEKLFLGAWVTLIGRDIRGLIDLVLFRGPWIGPRIMVVACGIRRRLLVSNIGWLNIADCFGYVITL